MKIKLTLILTSLTLLLSLNLNAKEQTNWYNGVYVGGGLGVAESIEYTDQTTNDFLANNYLLNVFVGYELYKYLDIEAGFSMALEEETIMSGYPMTAPKLVDNYYTLNVAFKPKYAIKNYEQNVVFAILGVSYMSSEHIQIYQNALFDFFGKEVVFNLGLGYEYKINNNHSIAVSYTHNMFYTIEIQNIDYTDYYNMNYDTLNLNYKYTFK